MKVYNDRKICFIICTNNKQYLEECLLYLSMLDVPEGFEIELLTIENAKSMTAGYNEAMNASNAKYKIYMHQDVFILDRKILFQIIDIFQSDKKIGLIGTIGSEVLPKDAVMMHGLRCGNFYRLEENQDLLEDKIKMIDIGYCEVEAVDGLFMATQYDIAWREDLLDGWDFYDVSQCLEFRRAGYKVIVPAQQSPWVNHDCGVPSFWKYNMYREIVLKEYPELQKKEHLRIYFILSKEIGILGIPYSLEKLGHEVILSERNISVNTYDERAVELIEEQLEEGNYDLVMSYDLLLVVAAACNNKKVKYWAWVYDSPLLDLYAKEAQLPYLYISVFDKKQYERLQCRKLSNLFYLPLATEVNYFEKVEITKEDEKQFKADVSFVGSLYDKRGFEELFDEHHKNLREEAEMVAKSCDCIWDGKTTLFGKASDELIAYMVSKENEELWEMYNIDKRYYCESMRIARKCNEFERVKILNSLAEKFNVTLYTNKGEKAQLKNIKICPWVDYWCDMPKAFYMSKINLNITSRSIESGIPQRVFDIMAVGGFCLTNYQPEIEDYFEIGKEIEVYHNLNELIEKVDYYLKHEKERIRIAMNGYLKVKDKHDYQVRIRESLAKIMD